MTNEDVVAALDEIALLLEYLGENPFRCRAYRQAARTVSGLEIAVAESRRAGRDVLAGLPGIGVDLAEKIHTLADTGRLPILDELRGRVPPVALDVARVPGLGPKKARVLVETLGIDSLEALAEACREGRVAAVKGFGDKTQTALLRDLGFALDPRTQRLPWNEAERIAGRLRDWLGRCPAVTRVEVAGSVRRGRATVGRITVVAATADPQAVREHFAAWPESAGPVADEGPCTTLRGPKDLPVELCVTSGDAFATALVARTGSTDHVRRLAARAAERGVAFDAGGVSPLAATGAVSEAEATDERAVYASLGLPWIPPELREGRDEIERAVRGALPRLVTVDDVRGDLHMHTTASDGEATLAEMVAAARARGLEYIAITDHGPRVAMARGLGPDRLLAQWEEIDRLNASLGAAEPAGFVVLKGVEVDMLEQGGLDLPDDLLARADWVVASLHYGQRQSRRQITARIIEALENPWVSVIGHPTGRLINRRPAYDVDIDAVIAAAARTGTCLEINANPWRLDLDDRHAAAAREAGVGLVVSTDAHSTAGLDNLRYGILQARRAGCAAEDVVNTLSLAEFRTRFARRG